MPQQTSDEDIIQQGYENSVLNLFDTLVLNMIDNDPDPDGKFQRGLAIVRRARDSARGLVNE